jgi:hypothetical protein
MGFVRMRWQTGAFSVAEMGLGQVILPNEFDKTNDWAGKANDR